MSELVRKIVIMPAWDKRSSDPKKNYGIHSAELAFYLTGPSGVIQFVVYTGWNLPHVDKDLERRGLGHSRPMAEDIGYHAYQPQYDGQTLLRESCPLLNGAPCYYDGSSLNAEPIFDLLLSDGDEAVWKRMEEIYHDRFGHEVRP